MAVAHAHLPTLVDVLRFHVSQHPDKNLYTFLADGEGDGASMSYADLDRRAKAIASQLQTQAKAGDCALMLFHSGLDFLEAFMACFYAGIIPVPAYPPRKNHNLNRLKAIVSDCRPSIVMSSDKVRQVAEPMFHEAFSVSEQKLAWLASDTVDDTAESQYQAFTPEASAIAFLQYTSGSTGNPKGVMVTHANLVYNQRMLEQAFDFGVDSICVSWLPLFHDMGLIGNALHPLYIGSEALLMPPASFLQKPLRWLQAIHDAGKTKPVITSAPNFAYQLCLDQISDEQKACFDFSNWRLAISAAEPVRQETLEGFMASYGPQGFKDTVFAPSYGLAETTLVVTGYHNRQAIYIDADNEELEKHQVKPSQDPEKSITIVGCGHTVLDETVLIVDPESKTILADGEVGEVWVAGEHIPLGYWEKEEVTKETFHAYTSDGQGPFLRTGDLAAMLDGELFITGRLKDLIIIHGRNHYPTDIEKTAEASHEALRTDNSAAFSVTVHGEEQLVVTAEVERTHRRNLDIDATAAVVREAIAKEHEVPVYAIVFLRPGAMLKTSSGKIQRSGCKQAFLSESLNSIGEWRATGFSSSGAGQVPSTDSPFSEQNTESLQAWIAQWISYRRGVPVEDISPDASFASIGLDSVDSVQLMAALESWVGNTLDTNEMWELENSADLVAYLLAPKESANEQSTESIEGFI